MILIDVNEKVLIPVNEGIFRVSQFKSQAKLNKVYCGCLLLYPDGMLKQISKIFITGFRGKGYVQKLMSILNSTHSVRVELEQVEIDVPKLKKQLVEYLKNDSCSPDPYLPQGLGIEHALSEIERAGNLHELYAALEVPEENDRLDVL